MKSGITYFFHGIDKSYKRWIWHGEMPISDVCAKNNNVDFDKSDDIDYVMDMVCDMEEGFVGRLENYMKLLKDVEIPLYDGCTKFTKLSTLVQIFNLKATNG